MCQEYHGVTNLKNMQKNVHTIGIKFYTFILCIVRPTKTFVVILGNVKIFELKPACHFAN